ncbi:shikimate dehydrogenase [Dysgonomonas sp. PH5-45]|uniref:shikimate dehydrogenase family protein n=1 Tax=unclassified Dysgonomonas TaxID=2630389 RepID=UPI00247339DB|nr:MULTISPECIES: shikimate dehydrogenase [unclassified Dysgonomonas]MDH6355935.1 shikimate dehydrogenase [Dysgonomonas sp. PH5-45]MDH6388830.1 shikimate dehydrogenase [Dysgonomonas sp. PH5-37]
MPTFGLVGFPLGHSFSKKYFVDKFVRENIDAQYLNFELSDIGQIEEILSHHPTLKGLNITIPHKKRVIKYLNLLDESAQAIGAVNVVKVERDSFNNKITTIGYNTDVVGFQKSIAPLINKDIHKKALILGTGGAAMAVAQGLKNLGIEYRYVSRSKADGVFTYSELDDSLMSQYTIIVNATPVGTFPNVDEAPDIPYHMLTTEHLLYDLVYNPEQTMFLRKGSPHTSLLKNGMEMLILQAEAAWEIWNG